MFAVTFQNVQWEWSMASFAIFQSTKTYMCSPLIWYTFMKKQDFVTAILLFSKASQCTELLPIHQNVICSELNFFLTKISAWLIPTFHLFIIKTGSLGMFKIHSPKMWPWICKHIILNILLLCAAIGCHNGHDLATALAPSQQPGTKASQLLLKLALRMQWIWLYLWFGGRAGETELSDEKCFTSKAHLPK